MEVAGLVVGVLPLAVTALQCYEACRGWSATIRMRKSYIRTLARSLQGYEAGLLLDLKIILQSIEPEHDWNVAVIKEAIQDQDRLEDIKAYLGDHADAFQQTLEDVNDILTRLACSIEGFLDAPTVQSDRISLSSVAFAQKQDVQVKFRSGIKLALHKKELDEYTQRLRQSTEILSKIQGSTTMVHSMTNKSFFGRSHKLVKSLRRVQSHANRLHKAISSVWRSDCHAVHETKLLIEDRIEDSRSRGMRLGKNTMSVQFDVVFGFSTGGSTGYLLQGVVEIIPQDCQEHSGAMKSDNNAVKVKFSPPQGQHMISNSSSKVQDICSELQKAGRSQKPLFLQLQDPNVLYMKECEKHTQSLYTNPSTSVTLHELLESSTQLRNVLSIRASLRLALALASGVLQLHMTPWFCNNFWSKEGIYFLKSSVHDIDITRPMTSCAFKASPVTAAFDSEPRHVLLELGITFLELWRGVTIEQKFAGRESQLKGDYFDRLHLAWRWLEESQDHLLDYQSQAVEFCMKPIFLNQNAKVRWDDDDFLASLTANVIEPLHRAIKPRPSHAT